MKAINIVNFKRRSVTTAFLLSLVLGLFGSASQIFAHGGEDHGGEKPKAPTAAGTVSRTARLGDFEVMLKHPLLEPDTASAGRLFITRFATNEPFSEANPAIEIEPANGGQAFEIPVEKTEAGGSYLLKIPALPEGAYTIRVKATVGGKTGTTTFSDVEIAHQEAAAADGGSVLQTVGIVFLFLVALALLGGLVYFVLKVIKNKPISEETVSA